MSRRYAVPLALLLIVAGCDSAGLDGAAPEALTPAADGVPTASLQTVPATATLNGYTVEYLGTQATAAGTQFSYRVTGIDPAPPALDWLFLENACSAAPAALAPSNAVDPVATVDGMAGVKWTASLPAGQSRVYSTTFSSASVGVARLVLRRGGVSSTVALPGPCGGHYLRGSVFVNGDADPARSADELGVGNVRVDVYQGAALVASETTAADGSYAFLLVEGSYDVRVPATEAGAFNATLYGSYTAVGGVEPAHRAVTLAADVAGLGFGFSPDAGTIVSDLQGAYRTQARDVRFWTQAVRRAGRNAACDASDPTQVCRATLSGLLSQIFSGDGDAATYLLANPYVLPAGADPFDRALAILSSPAKTELEIVTQNLFAMELNRLNGWGTPDARYDDALMSYLEGWVARGGAGSASAAASLRAPLATASATAAEGGGGGGGVEEGMTTAYLDGGGGGGGGVED